MHIEVDGRRAFAATGGKAFDPALPAVVFVHGAGMDHTVWQLQARYFAHRGRAVLAVDLPGHGASAGPALASIAEMGAWLIRLLDAVGAERAAIAGHSMGALAALAAAAGALARVSALALLGVAAEMPVHPDLLAAARRDDHLALDLITSWGFGRRSHLGGHRAPGLWMTGGGLRLLERGARGVLAADLAACAAAGDVAPLAANVACPALLVLGGLDLMTPAKGARRLIEAMPAARAVTLETCGHMMMIEQPDRTLDALRAVL